MDEEKSLVEAAAEAATKATTLPADQFVTGNGVVLKVHRVPRTQLLRLMAQGDPPKPPRVMNTEKGRLEENPDDPDYREALDRYNTRQATIANDAVLLMAVDVVSVPATVPAIESLEWREEATMLGQVVGTSPRVARLAWLYHCVLLEDSDFEKLWEITRRVTGTAEEVVKRAQDGFRS